MKNLVVFFVAMLFVMNAQTKESLVVAVDNSNEHEVFCMVPDDTSTPVMLVSMDDPNKKSDDKNTKKTDKSKDKKETKKNDTNKKDKPKATEGCSDKKTSGCGGCTGNDLE